jgi:hypothetical protein
MLIFIYRTMRLSFLLILAFALIGSAAAADDPPALPEPDLSPAGTQAKLPPSQ